MTSRWRSRLKIRVTLTLMPCAVASVIASRPSIVAGILIITLGRSTFAQSCLACAIVPAASCARPGSTSIETRPSTPPVRVVDRAEDVATRSRRRAVVISNTAS